MRGWGRLVLGGQSPGVPTLPPVTKTAAHQSSYFPRIRGVRVLLLPTQALCNTTWIVLPVPVYVMCPGASHGVLSVLLSPQSRVVVSRSTMIDFVPLEYATNIALADVKQ
jgi:hypothetical protein